MRSNQRLWWLSKNVKELLFRHRDSSCWHLPHFVCETHTLNKQVWKMRIAIACHRHPFLTTLERQLDLRGHNKHAISELRKLICSGLGWRNNGQIGDLLEFWNKQRLFFRTHRLILFFVYVYLQSNDSFIVKVYFVVELIAVLSQFHAQLLQVLVRVYLEYNVPGLKCWYSVVGILHRLVVLII